MATNINNFSGIAATISSRLNANICTIKADPQDIISTANTLKKKIDKLQHLFDTMIDTVNQTSSYWQGDASNKYRNDFSEERPEFEENFRRLLEHVEDLNTIASQYIDVEARATGLAESLLNNVID